MAEYSGASKHGDIKAAEDAAGLAALISRAARAVMYELVELGEEVEIDGRAMFAVRSRGEVFPIMPADKLKRMSS